MIQPFAANNEKNLSVKPDYNSQTSEFKHSWAGLGNIDQMLWMTRQDCLDQLEAAHKDLHMNHVRAVGLFDDNLSVVGKDPRDFNNDSAKPRRNWQNIDYIFDSLLDRGISPMFTTTFMPESLASGNQTVFETKNNVSLPKSYKDWENLVIATLEHMIHRYGKSRMEGWYYEVWNEPNLGAFFGGTKEDFFKLWKVSYDAIKRVHPQFRLGGPSTARAEWIPEFIEYARKNDCMPDYLIGHIYNNDSEYAALSPFAGPQEDKINKSPNFLGGVIRGVSELASSMNFKGEIHWNEWGRSWFPFDPMRESANEAAFIVKSMAEVSQYADYFAYWCLSDIYNQLGFGAETFHGNYGMMNLQGLKKPSYFAHQLLSMMSEERYEAELNSSEPYSGTIATKEDNSLQVMIYVYDPEFLPDRNTSKEVNVRVLLPVDYNEKSFRIFRLSEKHNNIVSEWKEQGSPPYLKYEERDKWKEMNKLTVDKKEFRIDRSGKEHYLELKMNTPGVVNIQFDD
jgi:xylan 1,4-beta-xylosidase